MATTTAPKPKNPDRISLREFVEDQGYDSLTEYLEENHDMLSDSVVPALCAHDCQVEPDGRCEHGCPSILLAMGVI